MCIYELGEYREYSRKPAMNIWIMQTTYWLFMECQYCLDVCSLFIDTEPVARVPSPKMAVVEAPVRRLTTTVAPPQRRDTGVSEAKLNRRYTVADLTKTKPLPWYFNCQMTSIHDNLKLCCILSLISMHTTVLVLLKIIFFVSKVKRCLMKNLIQLFFLKK